MASEAQPARTESHEGTSWLRKLLLPAVVLAIAFLAMPAAIPFFAAYSWIIGPVFTGLSLAAIIGVFGLLWSWRERE